MIDSRNKTAPCLVAATAPGLLFLFYVQTPEGFKKIKAPLASRPRGTLLGALLHSRAVFLGGMTD